MNTFGTRYTLYKSNFVSYPAQVGGELYKQAYRDACAHFECKTKVDDGDRGTGWMFFETRQEMETWKNQK